MRYAMNHITTPKLSLRDFFALSRELGISRSNLILAEVLTGALIEAERLLHNVPKISFSRFTARAQEFHQGSPFTSQLPPLALKSPPHTRRQDSSRQTH